MCIKNLIMRKHKLLALTGVLLLLCSYTMEAQNYNDDWDTVEEEELTTEPGNSNLQITGHYTSNYTWRDVAINQSSLQASLDYTFGYSGFSLNLWGGYMFESKLSESEFSASLNYTFEIFKDVNTTFGLNHYVAPVTINTVDFYREKNFSEYHVGLSAYKFLDTSLDVWLKGDDKSIYSSLSLGKSISFRKSKIYFNGVLGYRTNGLDSANGFRNLNLFVSTPFQMKRLQFNLFTSVNRIFKSKTTAFQIGIDITTVVRSRKRT